MSAREMGEVLERTHAADVVRYERATGSSVDERVPFQRAVVLITGTRRYSEALARLRKVLSFGVIYPEQQPLFTKSELDELRAHKLLSSKKSVELRAEYDRLHDKLSKVLSEMRLYRKRSRNGLPVDEGQYASLRQRRDSLDTELNAVRLQHENARRCEAAAAAGQDTREAEREPIQIRQQEAVTRGTPEQQVDVLARLRAFIFSDSLEALQGQRRRFDEREVNEFINYWRFNGFNFIQLVTWAAILSEADRTR